MDSDALNKLTPEQQNQLIVGIKQEAAVANLQTLISVFPNLLIS
jgi:hypothetical protein